ncbi:ABC transporter substrate-binding protein [Agrobacterium sp. Ap1]|jgi:branched-chain amino acid transport system substrate-binding protein|uniref:ABC transporter substrate-binding protein n=1 Tax=Agrobacterium sp. Ap1 TaxID=2815337 RepID=UPI001A8D8E6A|nr:ABC transporter substrate-binding protein [Agrobacterium sp. Ap1]MBO0145018.1 ABC transporter substrate-binding protein [Agrobacterium sp. Ap1]
MKKIAIGATFAAVFAGVVTAAPARAEEITIGAVIPLSGASATTGKDQSRGIELALKEINAKGGVLGKQMKVIVEDSGGKPQTAIDAAKKLVSVDKVPIVIGEYSSGNTIPLGQYLVQEGIPHINPASTSGLVRGIGATSYSVVGLDNVSTEFAAQDVIDHGWKKVAVLAMNNAFGQGVAEEFKKNFTAKGGEITTTVMYTIGQSTYRRELQQVEAAAPDAYVFTAYGTEGALIMQEAFELGLQEGKPWYSILITMMNKDTPADFKEGLIGMDVGYIGDDGDAYKTEYEKTYGETFLSAYGGYAHDAVLFAAAALNKAGSTDQAAVLRAIEDLGKEGVKGATGEIKLDADGQRTHQPYLKFKVEGEKLVAYD